MTDPSTTEKAQAAASTAVDEGRHVTGVAKDEAQNVASEVSAQTRQLVGETRQQVAQQLDDQSRQQRDKLVGTLGTLSDDLSQMADRSESSGLAVQAAREVADRTRSLQSYLDGRDPSELLDDARDFARRRPGVFLLGALVAGVVAGRVVRGAKDAPQAGAGSTAPTPTTPVAPVATPTSGYSSGSGYGSGYAAPGYGETPGAVGSYPPPPVSPTPVSAPPVGQGYGSDPLAGDTRPQHVADPGQGLPPLPPLPGETPGTVDPGPALDDDGPMGTNAAGYGRRDGLEGPA
ncbi:hypothetical protein INN71_17440 [Nocardioides sp. ChNu-153]|uniref:hypothetical protein n=1 Tax=unclassified Nocardioides TaxID=2615069 RepID=UPI0024051327|nr:MULTISPECIES: hypothetical protein [unclassified Nocardioides]MDF9716888.1 hypothetical protein [Nocardioides sp. ChNu-99]MDN7123168.1 hypothetical protein [Nocardioides sp. ChNu-153]